MVDENQLKTKIVIVGGFLGSGKTTAIKELGKLFAMSGKTVTYFTNEIGEVSIDGDLLNYDMETKEVTTACITCNMKEKMTAAAEQLIEKAHPDILFMEPKETVSPLVVKDELEKAALNRNGDEYNFAPLFTLINCSEFFKNIKEKKKISFDQITVSEIIVLNKTDLISPNELKMIQESVMQINPKIKIIENDIQNTGIEKIKEIIENN
jgi:Putative GTPases (G3E family)